MFPNKQKRINEKDSIMEKAITLSFLITRTLMPCLPVVCESDTAPNELNRFETHVVSTSIILFDHPHLEGGKSDLPTIHHEYFGLVIVVDTNQAWNVICQG